MNNIHKATGARGQALVELAVILPVLVLFMAIVLPLIANGITLPWLDERLTLRQLDQDDDQIHHQLSLTHSSDLLPPYFEKTWFRESSRKTSMGMTIPFLGDTYPGYLTRKLTVVSIKEHPYWNRAVLASQKNRQITRELTMIKTDDLVESRVPNEVKRLTLLGIAPKTTGFLERAGLNLFHLNLNALPDGSQSGGEK